MQILRFSREQYRVFFCGALLSLYMLLTFGFYFAVGGMKVMVTMLLMLLSVASLIVTEIKNYRIKFNLEPILFWGSTFLFVVMLQIINGTLNPRVLYLVATPCFAYFFINNKFNTKLLYLPLLIEWIVLAYFVVTGADLNNIFDGTSRNYISVVMIVNVVTVNIVEWRQEGKVTVWPGIISFYFSLLAIGRSGIICSLLLLLGLLYFSYKQQTVRSKIMYLIIIIIPIIIYIVIEYENLFLLVSALPVLDRFNSMGMDTDYRDLLIESYLNHMNPLNIILGYNYENNLLFACKDLNPHNSIIFLHYNTGIVFFIAILFLIRSMFNLFKNNKFFLMLMILLLLRGWTDSYLFLGPYDFLILSFILISKETRYVR